MLYHYIVVYMYSCTDIPTIGTPHSSITAKVSTDVTLAVTVHGTYPQISSVVWTKNGINIDDIKNDFMIKHVRIILQMNITSSTYGI
jgi:hypothetical protein